MRGKEERGDGGVGEGVEVRIVCTCNCGSVSIVVGDGFFSFLSATALSSQRGLQVQLRFPRCFATH